MQPPPWVFFLNWPPNGWAGRAEILHNLWGILCINYGKRNCQKKNRKEAKEVRSQSYDVIGDTTSYRFLKEIVFSAIELVVTDLNGDIMRALGQKIATYYLWHCILTFRRKPEVTHFGWPLVQKCFILRFFRVSWGPETEWDIMLPNGLHFRRIWL